MRRIVLPSLPPLTESAKQNLIESVEQYAKTDREVLLHYLETGEVTFDELRMLDHLPEFKAWLEQEYTVWHSSWHRPEMCFDESCVDCPPGTDVFFVGLPATGKTCVLAGLLRSGRYIWDCIRYGGKYGSELTMVLDQGELPCRTPRDFATVISGRIIGEKRKVSNPFINLIEISGDLFADEAKYPTPLLPFADRDDAFSHMLCNPNGKVLFIVVDPTTEVVTCRRQVESNGNWEVAEIKLRQEALLNRCILRLALEESKTILNQVHAIHFLVSKADVFGPREKRRDKAHELIHDRYPSVFYHLRDVCRLNRLPEPQIIPFSLGEFKQYAGGFTSFEYDPRDSVALLSFLEEQELKR